MCLTRKPGFCFGNVFQQEADVLPDPKLLFGRIVEDVEGDLVADARCR